MKDIFQIEKIIKANDEFRDNSLNLIASENITSNFVSKLYNNSFQHKYACGIIGERHYAGCKWVDELEILTSNLIKQLFKCKFVNLSPISGVIANLISYNSLLNPGDKVCVIEPTCGSHYSHHKKGMLGISGMKPVFLPFDMQNLTIDINKAENIIKNKKPSMLIIGASEMLFPVPIKELREFYNGLILYDSSHVLGLIAGEKFQDPLKEGVDLISTSTHKTFFGPQGAMILTNDEDIYLKTMENTFNIISNHHIHRFPALAFACLEMLKFGKNYAHNVVKNAKILGRSLFKNGLNVLGSHKGFTETHQVILDVGNIGDNFQIMKLLESAHILTSPCPLPYNNGKDTGIRLGVQELTRIGMSGKEMNYIGKLISSLLIDQNDIIKIKEEVINLRHKFMKIHYTFETSET